MHVLEKKREDIEAKAKTMSDFLKMEYFESCLKTNLDVNVSKYCYRELANLYEQKLMYPEAVKNISKFRELCFDNKEKINALLRETELLIKSGLYNEANYTFKKAMDMANEYEKYEIRRKAIEFYQKQAQKFEKGNYNSSALKVYEVLVNLVVDAEKNEIKKRMLVLYKKLGKVRELIKFEKEFNSENLI
jgi:hypothetical protein